MKLALLLPLMTLLMVAVALAQPLEMCGEEQVSLFKNCTIVTSSLSCANLTYDIVNLSGVKVVDNASLTPLSGNVSSLNFTLTDSKADYVVVLCDGSTREVRVRGGGMSALWVVAALPVFMSFILLGVAAVVNPKEHMLLKNVLLGAAVFMIFPALGFGFVLQNELLASAALNDSMTDFLRIMVWLAFFITAYFAYYFIIKIFDSIRKKRLENMEY